jgi:alanine racemase
MVEAVGQAYWPTYFASVARLLKEGGHACIQSIVIEDRLFARYIRSTDFIQQYIFPGGCLPCPREFRAQARAAGLAPELVHLAATQGALAHPDARFDLVRLGIGAYGLRPDVEPVPGLVPAMELAAPVVSVKRVPAGHGVSYGYDHRTVAETTLALVPLGYADGVPRSASGRGLVSIDGVRHTVAGRVAMDQIVLDVGDSPTAVGDRAVLFGNPATGVPSADDWAAAAGTINYEIVTRIGSRVPRRYVP